MADANDFPMQIGSPPIKELVTCGTPNAGKILPQTPDLANPLLESQNNFNNFVLGKKGRLINFDDVLKTGESYDFNKQALDLDEHSEIGSVIVSSQLVKINGQLGVQKSSDLFNNDENLLPQQGTLDCGIELEPHEHR